MSCQGKRLGNGLYPASPCKLSKNGLIRKRARNRLCKHCMDSKARIIVNAWRIYRMKKRMAFIHSMRTNLYLPLELQWMIVSFLGN